jgi:hypothetical protein
MAAVQDKWYRFVWKSVPMGTYMYREKKMAPGFTMAKEQTTVLCQVAQLRTFLLEAICHLLVENLVFLKVLLCV